MRCWFPPFINTYMDGPFSIPRFLSYYAGLISWSVGLRAAGWIVLTGPRSGPQNTSFFFITNSLAIIILSYFILMDF